MKALEEAAKAMLDDLLEQARSSATLEGRLEKAIGPCTLAGGPERHLELVRELVEKATAPR